MKPGSLVSIFPREQHWHPNANEWQYYAKGHARVTLFGSGDRMTTADFGPGDVAYIPQGYGHSVQNIGTEECEIVLTFDSGHYQEISISEWIATSPPHLLANNFGVDESVFANFPKKQGLYREGLKRRTAGPDGSGRCIRSSRSAGRSGCRVAEAGRGRS